MMLPTLLLLLATVGEGASAPLPLKAALDEAAANGPSVLEARARVALARGEVAATQALEPVTLALGGGGNDPRWAVGLSQRVNPFGARNARVTASQADARAAALEQRQAVAESRASARKAYFDLLRAQQLVEVARRSLQLALQSEEAARRRFETGAAPELDVLQASLARAAAQGEVTAREGEQAALSAELARLLGRDPGPLLRSEPGPVPTLPPVETVLARAGEAPGLLATRATVAAEEARLDATRRERLPAVRFGVSAEGEGPGGKIVSPRAALEFEFPLMGLNAGPIARAQAAVGLARTLEEDAVRGRKAAVLAAHRRLEAALGVLARYPAEILPGAERSEKMALEAYTTGRTSLTTLNEARRAAADLRAQAIEAEFHAQSAFADLELAAGVVLDEN